jgi:hypothetical protein
LKLLFAALHWRLQRCIAISTAVCTSTSLGNSKTTLFPTQSDLHLNFQISSEPLLACKTIFNVAEASFLIVITRTKLIPSISTVQGRRLLTFHIFEFQVIS